MKIFLFRLLVFMFAFFCLAGQTEAATKNINIGFGGSDSITWAQAIPMYSIATGDSVVIQNNIKVRVTANATIRAVLIGLNGSLGGTLGFASGTTLTVNGSVTVGNNTQTGTLDMTNGGTLNCTSLARGFYFGPVLTYVGTFLPGSGTVEIVTATSNLANFNLYNVLKIKNAAVVTMTGDATISNIQMGVSGGGAGTLKISTGVKLTVTTIKIGDIAQSGTLDMTAGGTIYCNALLKDTGTFTPGIGTIETKSAITLPAGITTYYNLNINPSSGATNLGVNTIVSNDLQVMNGTLNTTASNYSLTVGGVTTIYTSQTLSLNASQFIVSGNLVINGNFTAGTSTTQFNKNTTISGSTTPSFYKFQVNLNDTVTLPANCSVSNNWVNNGTVFPGTGTVIFIGTTAAQTITGNSSQTFYNLNVFKGSGTLSATGISTLNVNDFNQVLGNFTPSNTMNVYGNWAWTAGIFNAGTGTVVFNGTGLQSLANDSSTTYYNVTVNKASGTLTENSTKIIINNRLTMTSGTFIVGTKTLSGTASLIETGGDLQMALLSTTLPALTGSSYSITGGTITLNGAGAQTLKPSISYYNVVVGNSGVKTICNITAITNNLTISGSATITCNAALVVGGILTYSSSGSSTLTASTNISVGSFVISAGTFIDNGNTISVTGQNWTKNGGTFTATGKVDFTSTSDQTIGGSATTTFNKLYHSGTGTTTLAVATVVGNELNISAGIVDGSTYSFSGGANVNMSAGELKIGECYTASPGLPRFTGTYTLSAGTVTFNGTCAQLIRSATYFNLNLAGSGTKTFLASLVIVRGALTKAATVNADFRTNLNSFKYDGTGANMNQPVLALDYYSLQFGTVGTKTFASGTTRIRRTFSTAGAVGDALTNQTTIIFDGTAGQTITSATIPNYYNLTDSNTVGLTISSGSVNLYNTMTLKDAAIFTNNGTLTFKSVNTGALTSNTARLAEVPANATFNGNIVFERYLPPLAWDGDNGFWHMMAAPVKGISFSGVRYNEAIQNTNMDIGYTYGAATTTETVLSDSAEGGFKDFHNSGARSLYTFAAGPPKIGDYLRTISSTVSGNDLADGWNLVTNPYPCEIVWNQFGIDINLVGKAAYIWSADSLTGTAHYISFLMTDLQTIASCQSFWVKVTGAGVPTAGSIKFREPSKANSDPTQSIYRMASSLYPHLKLKMVDDSGAFDNMDIRFVQGASMDLDPENDSYKLYANPAHPYISTFTNDNIQAQINSYPELTQNVDIPIIARCANSGTFTMETDLSGFAPSSCVFLQDLETGTSYDLRTTSSFTFDVTGNSSDNPRFLLRVSPPVSLNITDASCTGGNYSGSALAAAQDNGPWIYTWKDAGGNIIRGPVSSAAADSISSVDAGNYTVTVSNASGICPLVTEPVSIGGFSPIAANAVVTSASCFSLHDGAIDLAPSGGLAPFSFAWSNSAASEDVNNLPAGSYSVTMADANNCHVVQNLVVSAPAPINPNFSLSASTLYLSAGAAVSFTNSSTGASAYHWNFGDASAAITTANASHTYTAEGTYNVTLDAMNGVCSSTIIKEVLVQAAPLGMEDKRLNEQVKIFSHDGNLFIDFNLLQTRTVSINVINVLGESIWETKNIKALDNTVTVNLSSKAEGVYLVQLNFEDKTITGKIAYSK